MTKTMKASLCVFAFVFLICISVIFWNIAQWASLGLLAINIYIFYEDYDESDPIGLLTITWSIAICNLIGLLWNFLPDGFISILIVIAIFIISFWPPSKIGEHGLFHFTNSLLYCGLYLIISIWEYNLWMMLIIPVAITLIWYIVYRMGDEQDDYSNSIATTGVISFICVLLFITQFAKDDKTIDYPTVVLTPKEKEVEEKIATETKQTELLIITKMNQYFDSLKTVNDLPKTINPEFKLTPEIISDKRVMRAEYSYTTINEVFEAEVTDYAPGEYKLSKSRAAYEMLKIVDYSLKNFLIKNLEQGEEIQIGLFGFADGLQFKVDKPKYYDGFEGGFPKQPTTDDPSGVRNYELNDQPVADGIQLKANNKLTNETLAFLRAYCMKSDYLVNIVPLRNITAKTRYTYHVYTQPPTEKANPKLRKVKLVLEIVNPDPALPKPPKTEPVKSNCSPTITKLSWLIALGLFTFAGYHYKKYDDKLDSYEPRSRHIILAVISVILAGLIIICVWFWCPDSLNEVVKT